jgi:regulator-associated protein of mTOR
MFLTGTFKLVPHTQTRYLNLRSLSVFLPTLITPSSSNAGNILLAFNRFAEQRDREAATKPPDVKGTDLTGGQMPYVPMKECIQLAACGPNEVLPMNPDLPADVFSCCLTTPIEIALRWFVTQNPLLKNVQPDMIMKIPGRLNDRRTPLGELNWIFTAITDTIAWNVLPHDLFKRLFRQDLMVAALFRNYLLAERIMRYHSCTPMSSPALPITHQHPMWSSWDLAAETCLSQLPALLKAAEGGPPVEYRHSTFFAEQLTAFEVWLSKGAISKGHPEQLPIVLQVLLSQVHRLRALMLLSRFLDLGPWSVNLALSVGIFPYVLKLLQSPAAELKPVLVFIWAKILAVDRSCQNDLLKDNGFTYFINILTSTNAAPVIPNMSEHRAMCAFILSVFCHGFKAGQEACLKNDLLATLVLHLEDQDPLLRQWVCIGLAKLWDGYAEARHLCFKYNIQEKLLPLLTDSVAEVRAAAMYAIGNLVQDKYEKTEFTSAMEYSIGFAILNGMADGSPVVRKELIILLAKVVRNNFTIICSAAADIIKEDQRRTNTSTKTKRISVEPGHFDATSSSNPLSPSSSNARSPQTMHGCVYKSLLTLSVDPLPLLAALASHIVDSINTNLISANLVSPSRSLSSSTSSTPKPPSTPKPSSVPPRSETPPAGKLGSSASSLKRSSSFVNTFKSFPGFSALINSIPIPTTPASAPTSTPAIVDSDELTDGSKKQVEAVGTLAEKLLPLYTNDIQKQHNELLAHYSKAADCTTVSLESTFFEWSLEYFAEPQMRVGWPCQIFFLGAKFR